MKKPIENHLKELAKMLELTHVKKNQYTGKYGTVFFMTSWGFLTRGQYLEHLTVSGKIHQMSKKQIDDIRFGA